MVRCAGETVSRTTQPFLAGGRLHLGSVMGLGPTNESSLPAPRGKISQCGRVEVIAPCSPASQIQSMTSAQGSSHSPDRFASHVNYDQSFRVEGPVLVDREQNIAPQFFTIGIADPTPRA
jgi:hypothetical protein